MSVLKLNVKMAPLMSIFIEGLLSYRNEFRIIKDVFNKAFLAFMSDGVFLSLPSRLETTTKKNRIFQFTGQLLLTVPILIFGRRR